MRPIELKSPGSIHPTNGYSHVAEIKSGSRLIWTSGQVALDAGANLVGPDDWGAQTRQAMWNVEQALRASGAAWDDVFRLVFFVTDTSELKTVRAVRDEFVNLERPPTSTLIKVAGLGIEGLLIEIEAIAAV
jgi:enamine deaminase RidA (YjgF/YER057c/UK114 family)